MFDEILHKSCELFIDDIVIHNKGDGFAEVELHLHFLTIMMKCLKESNLKLHPGKCKFLQRMVKYLGEIIEGGTVRPDPKKMKVVERLTKCITVSEVRHVLGILGVHRSYVKDYSKHALPLTKMLSLKESEVAKHWG